MLLVGCSSNDYEKSNHSYQDPLPDYWDSYYYERNYYNRLNRIEKRHKKELDKIEKEYIKTMTLKTSNKSHVRPIQEDQELNVKRD
jgi:hypothetical protein